MNELNPGASTFTPGQGYASPQQRFQQSPGGGYEGHQLHEAGAYRNHGSSQAMYRHTPSWTSPGGVSPQQRGQGAPRYPTGGFDLTSSGGSGSLHFESVGDSSTLGWADSSSQAVSPTTMSYSSPYSPPRQQASSSSWQDGTSTSSKHQSFFAYGNPFDKTQVY